MSKLIPQTFIDDLLTRVDIVDIVGSRVKLRKAGSNYSALCPFHTEKTPSFTVSPSKQFFHCFGCGAHGSAIGFLMQFENISFVEAVETLATQLGIEVPKHADQNNDSRLTELFQLTANLAKFYQAQLKTASHAIQYLKSRGLTGVICKQYGIGYAPRGWDNLQTIHKNATNLKTQLITTGFLIQKDRDTFARFKDRIMFPIHNIKGHIIGFGGRTLGNDSAKYLNSPETPIFHKGQELYALYEAKKANKTLNQIIVVEGYMDVVALAQFGVTNVVATLGTAITPKQVQQLLRQTSNIIFCFDGDTAGRKAAWRALENTLPLMRDGINIRFLFLPEPEDPDSLVRKEGTAKFKHRLESAITLADFFFQQMLKTTNVNTLDGRALLAKNATALITKMPHSVFQQLLFDKLAVLVQIDVNELKNLTEQPAAAVATAPATTNQLPSLMQMAINMLLHNPELTAYVTNLEEIQLIKLAGIEIFCKLINLLKNQPNLTIGAILEYWRDQPELSILAAIASKEIIIPSSGLKNEFLGIIHVLNQLSREQLIGVYLQKAATNQLSTEEKQHLQTLITNTKLTNIEST